jgi:hypothetical protein
VNKHKTVKPKPNSLKIKGKFKLVIRSSDDGTRPDTGTIQQEIRSDRQNRTVTSQLGTDRNYSSGYRKRSLLHHNHRGGITFTVHTPQEAARCMNLGIYLGGRKHCVFSFTRSRADDLCNSCSAWGHLERSYCASPRCGICSEHHRTDDPPMLITENKRLNAQTAMGTIGWTTVAV